MAGVTAKPCANTTSGYGPSVRSGGAPLVADGRGAPVAGYHTVVAIGRVAAAGAAPFAGKGRDASTHTSVRVPTTRAPTANDRADELGAGCGVARRAAIVHSRRASFWDSGTASSAPRLSSTATIPYV